MILCKTFNSIEDVNSCFNESCAQVETTMNCIVSNNVFDTYDDYVKWALDSCLEEIPSPFAIQFPACYNLSIGSTYFSIRFPNKFGFGIRVNLGKKNISYEVSITFFNNDNLIVRSDYYKEMIDNGWKVKELKHK